MKKLLGILTTASLALMLLALPLSIAQAQDAAEEEAATCEAYVYPESARSQSEPVEVHARLSADIGEVTDVEADEDSGLEIGDVETTESDSIVISVDTSAAQAGSWSLRFHGDQGVCIARWTVESEAAVGR